ncbi:hypothetical protein P775_09125 [Puniceibacterium antarcticum]|uniref:DUF1190 domain-containing protein n=1 Tax=Puniceibacterium antarcticum TaxID=1206336 RepID=A0A2G8RGK7_9RHOB|nr:DUF1190 domain-containing protein [Puniceibacterium antarcticum]PIL20679.1 hypothetical protein P775_09125 [Puniceibacterium antarcticum]
MSHPTRKRSRSVALCILGATAFALAGCREEQVDAQAFPDLASCKAASAKGGLFSVDECDQAFAEAEMLHVESAPRYDSLQVCEEQHGEGACGTEEQQVSNGGSGSIFMPLLAGYLIGNMLGGRGGLAAAQPLYRNGTGGYTDAARSNSYSSNAGKAKLGTSMFNKPTPTVGKPPMSRATAMSRGGFGSAGGSRGGFGG